MNICKLSNHLVPNSYITICKHWPEYLVQLKLLLQFNSNFFPTFIFPFSTLGIELNIPWWRQIEEGIEPLKSETTKKLEPITSSKFLLKISSSNITISTTSLKKIFEENDKPQLWKNSCDHEIVVKTSQQPQQCHVHLSQTTSIPFKSPFNKPLPSLNISFLPFNSQNPLVQIPVSHHPFPGTSIFSVCLFFLVLWVPQFIEFSSILPVLG